LGIHLEGPYLQPEFRGAQAPGAIRNPAEEEYLGWFSSGAVKLVTFAPEIPGGMEFAEAAAAHNVRLAIGHSAATYEQVLLAADAGVTQATHLFNGMAGLHHREPGTVGGILDEERIYTQIICDGIHLHPAVIRLILKAKSASRVILITDSVSGAGLPDGEYEHNGQKFTIRDGSARTPEGGLAGSVVALDQALRNMMMFTGKSLQDTLPMATSTPAEAMGISTSKGRVNEGYDADLVLLDQQYQVDQTLVNGQVVYTRG
jgi:N-acetylglucosamine-6-phosphate deacetylase